MIDLMLVLFFIGIPIALLIWGLAKIVGSGTARTITHGTWCTCPDCYQRDLKEAVAKREWSEQNRRIRDAVDEVFQTRGRR